MKFLRLIFKSIKESMAKFVISFYTSILLFILVSMQIIFEFVDNRFMVLILSVGFSSLFALTMQLISIKYEFSKVWEWVQRIGSALTMVVCYFLIGNIFDSDYVALGFFGSVLIVILVATYVMYDAPNHNYVFPQIIKSGFFSSLVAGLFFSGISLCLLALNFLVVELYEIEKWYLITLAFSYILLFYNILIATLPKKDSDIKIPNIFKVLVLYVGLPIYTLLMGVLYAYLVKILITFEMPQGQINIFASLASLFFIFFYLTLGCFETKATSFFKKYGGIFLLPIIVAQAIAVYIRVNAYGLTSLRYVSIIFSVTALIFIILTLIKKGKFVKFVILLFGVITLVSSIGPLNILDVPTYNQVARLEKVLVANGMLENNKVIPNKDISAQDKEAIEGSYGFLIGKKKAPDYLNKDVPFHILFGFERGYYNEGYDKENYYVNKNKDYQDLDIGDYKYYHRIESNRDANPYIIYINDTRYDIEEGIKAISKDSDIDDLAFDIGEDIRIYLSYLTYSIGPNDEVNYLYFEGFALTK